MSSFPQYPYTIKHSSHYHIKRIRRLRLRDERERTGYCYVEGMRFVAQAVHNCVKIEALVVCRPQLVHPFAQNIVRQQRKLGTPILEVTPDVLQSLTSVEDAQGIGAVVHQRWEPLANVTSEGESCWLALQRVRSPGNLGTILRTMDAIGGVGVMLLGDDIDPYEPGVIRATMGSVFTQRFVRTTCTEFAQWKRHSPYMLVGTSPSARMDYHSTKYRFPTIFLMGEERKGLPPELQSMCDMMVCIPMVGQCDSLNLAVATSIILYEQFNQRRAGSTM